MPSRENINRIGRYNIISKLGEGGMGIVFKAFDPVLERTVALKIGKLSSIALSASKKSTILAQCLNEARLAAQFIHPNIAIIHDAGFEKDLFYMAIEYVEGKGLEQCTRKPYLLPLKQVLEIIFNVCHALEYIHNKGYVHLDIKPSNIMLTRMGEVKLMDFGIARFLKDSPKDDKTISGSVHYMSPEQVDSLSTINFQADIFSLGVVLYELLTGKRPFEGEDMYQVLYNIVNSNASPIEKSIPDISPALIDIIDKSMHKEANLRFKTAREFADALLPVIKGDDSTTLNKQDKQKIDYLKRMIFFQFFQYSDLTEVIKISSWNSFRKNAYIVEESENDRNIYIIIEGRASLKLEKGIKVFNKGDCFGESALLFNMPRKAKVIADTDCLVMTINANLLNQSKDSLQVKFLKEFYKTKLQQLVDANLKIIQSERKLDVYSDESQKEKEPSGKGSDLFLDQLKLS